MTRGSWTAKAEPGGPPSTGATQAGPPPRPSIAELVRLPPRPLPRLTTYQPVHLPARPLPIRPCRACSPTKRPVHLPPRPPPTPSPAELVHSRVSPLSGPGDCRTGGLPVASRRPRTATWSPVDPGRPTAVGGAGRAPPSRHPRAGSPFPGRTRHVPRTAPCANLPPRRRACRRRPVRFRSEATYGGQGEARVTISHLPHAGSALPSGPEAEGPFRAAGRPARTRSAAARRRPCAPRRARRPLRR